MPNTNWTPEWESSHQVETGFGGYQPLNPGQYATEPTAGYLAELLGGTASLRPGPTTGPFSLPAQREITVGGQTHNAGMLASMYQRYQANAEQGQANYDLNLRNNPNLVQQAPLSQEDLFTQAFNKANSPEYMEFLEARADEMGAKAASDARRGGGGSGVGGGGSVGGGGGTDAFPRSPVGRFGFLNPRDPQEEPGTRRPGFDFFDRYDGGGGGGGAAGGGTGGGALSGLLQQSPSASFGFLPSRDQQEKPGRGAAMTPEEARRILSGQQPGDRAQAQMVWNQAYPGQPYQMIGAADAGGLS